MIDLGDIGRQRDKLGFFHEIDLLRGHAQRLFDLGIGHVLTPGPGLCIKVMQIRKSPSGQEVLGDIGKRPLYPGFPVRVVYLVGHKHHLIETAKGFHFRSNNRIRSGSGNDKESSVVHHTPGTDPLHEIKGPLQEDFGLKAGKAGIELDKDLAAVGQDQACALHSLLCASHQDLVRAGVVLHLFTRAKDILPTAIFFGLFDFKGAHHPGQGGVGDLDAVFFLQALLEADDISLAAVKEILYQRKMLLILGSLGLWLLIRKKHSAHCVPAHSQQLADLPDFDVLLMHLTDGFPHLW